MGLLNSFFGDVCHFRVYFGAFLWPVWTHALAVFCVAACYCALLDVVCQLLYQVIALPGYTCSCTCRDLGVNPGYPMVLNLVQCRVLFINLLLHLPGYICNNLTY